MVSAQRQFPGAVFAGRSGIEGEFEVACLADEKAVGGQDGTIGIGDSEAEFAGAILCPSQRGGEQEQGDVMAALIKIRRRWILRGRRGMPLGYFTAMAGGGWGRERYYFRAGGDVLLLYEQPAGMLPVRTTTFRDGGWRWRRGEAALGLDSRGRPVPTQPLDGRDARPHMSATIRAGRTSEQ